LAFNPSTNVPYIAYYDATEGALSMANQVSSGGNCGPDNTWICETVVVTDAQYLSIDVYPGSSHIIGSRKIGIAYYNPSTGSLKFAEHSCVLYNCDWSFSTIEAGFKSGSIWMLTHGRYASLKYDSSGAPHIAYYSSSALGDDSARYATRVGNGGNCGPNDFWHCESVDIGEGLGQHTSLDLNYEDQALIAYYDSANGDLKYAYYGGIGLCGAANAWICQPIDNTAGADVGLFASLSAPQAADDPLRVAYYDSTHGTLKYAFTSNGQTCGAANGWWCGEVDDIGTPDLTRLGISMVLDQDGCPAIAYQKVPADPGHTTLHLARPASAYSLMVGNCGDLLPNMLYYFWQCNAIDGAGAETNEADYVSLGFSSAGLGMIAYYEDDNYYDPNLKIAYQFWQVYLPLAVK
jgi:hypothetical protein